MRIAAPKQQMQFQSCHRDFFLFWLVRGYHRLAFMSPTLPKQPFQNCSFVLRFFVSLLSAK